MGRRELNGRVRKVNVIDLGRLHMKENISRNPYRGIK